MKARLPRQYLRQAGIGHYWAPIGPHLCAVAHAPPPNRRSCGVNPTREDLACSQCWSWREGLLCLWPSSEPQSLLPLPGLLSGLSPLPKYCLPLPVNHTHFLHHLGGRSKRSDSSGPPWSLHPRGSLQTQSHLLGPGPFCLFLPFS